jgi:hypothetical protein
VQSDENPRLQLLKDILMDEVSGPVIIVYRHRAVGEMLAAELAWGLEGLDQRRQRPEEIREATEDSTTA